MKKQKKNTGCMRIFASLLCIFLAIVIVIGIGATVLVSRTMNMINRETAVEATLSDEEIEAILQEIEPEDEVSEGAEPDEELDTELIEEEIILDVEDVELIGQDRDIINILLIGQDRRENQGRQRSDSMILCTVDLDEKTLVMTSFLRDTFVTLPSWNGKTYANNRLNVNYAIGGMGMLDKCLEENFGVVVNYNLEVDFSGFTNVVDAMGGVDVELTRAEAGHLKNGLKAGMNHLNGEQALAYSRIRKLDNDFGRTNRQRTVLLALLNRAKTMSLKDVTNLITEVLPMITTDMSNGDMIEVAAKVVPILPELKVTTQYIPAEGTYRYASIYGMSVLVPDLEANRQILKDTIG